MTNDRGPPPSWTNSNAENGTVRASYDWSSVTPSVAVIETVAVATDRESSTLPALYDLVDTDALDALVRLDGSPAAGELTTVSFQFADHRVRVHSTGEVVVSVGDSRESQ